MPNNFPKIYHICSFLKCLIRQFHITRKPSSSLVEASIPLPLLQRLIKLFHIYAGKIELGGSSYLMEMYLLCWSAEGAEAMAFATGVYLKSNCSLTQSLCRLLVIYNGCFFMCSLWLVFFFFFFFNLQMILVLRLRTTLDWSLTDFDVVTYP